MRLVIDGLIALMLVAVLAGVVIHHRHKQADGDSVQQVHEALAALYREARLQGPSDIDKDVASQTFPRVVDPAWFHDSIPVNGLAPIGQPWLDIAPSGDKQDHPPDPVITEPTQAGFWYNAERGVFRARVPQQLTDVETVDLYNRVNNTAIKAFPEKFNAARAPISLDDLQEPTIEATSAGVTSPAPRQRSLSDVAPRR